MAALDINATPATQQSPTPPNRPGRLRIPLDCRDAAYTRDAVAKALYERLFTSIVRNVNVALGQVPGSALPPIGVLDIFGFESFAKNGLEQLLINYASESLQSTFNQQVFEAELKLFAEENIECGLREYPNNARCVELLSSRNWGVLSSLNAECSHPSPTDAKFLAHLYDQCDGRSPYFLQPAQKADRKDAFAIRHYAGVVQYSVGDWILKNNDSIPEGLPDLARSSTSSALVASLFESDHDDERGRSIARPTVSSLFSGNMGAVSALAPQI